MPSDRWTPSGLRPDYEGKTKQQFNNLPPDKKSEATAETSDRAQDPGAKEIGKGRQHIPPMEPAPEGVRKRWHRTKKGPHTSSEIKTITQKIEEFATQRGLTLAQRFNKLKELFKPGHLANNEKVANENAASPEVLKNEGPEKSHSTPVETKTEKVKEAEREPGQRTEPSLEQSAGHQPEWLLTEDEINGLEEGRHVAEHINDQQRSAGRSQEISKNVANERKPVHQNLKHGHSQQRRTPEEINQWANEKRALLFSRYEQAKAFQGIRHRDESLRNDNIGQPIDHDDLETRQANEVWKLEKFQNHDGNELERHIEDVRETGRLPEHDEWGENRILSYQRESQGYNRIDEQGRGGVNATTFEINSWAAEKRVSYMERFKTAFAAIDAKFQVEKRQAEAENHPSGLTPDEVEAKRDWDIFHLERAEDDVLLRLETEIDNAIIFGRIPEDQVLHENLRYDRSVATHDHSSSIAGEVDRGGRSL